MNDLLTEYENKRCEIVFEWNDAETDAEGWVVINSLRGGAAGGGTRMRKGLDKHEVESLAKTMELKFTVSGPAIGGAKSGINFDPNDHRKAGVLKRWYAAVTPLLKHYYGTGGDLNVDELLEVIPITEDSGIWHPQEGVFNGHFRSTEAQKVNRIGQLRQGVIKVLEDGRYTPNISQKYTVADMITGWGVAQSVKHYYELWGGDITKKMAVIQGWGNVGASAGFYLSQMGVKIVGIIDRHGGLMNTEGFSFESIRQFFINRRSNTLMSDNMVPFEEINEGIWDMGFEIFVPCAASRLVTHDQVARMSTGGLEVLTCGANVPFADPQIFLGPIGLFADSQFSVIPDFIANCGIARLFAYLMSSETSMEDEAMFSDVSDTILRALKKTYNTNSLRTGITKSSFEIALKQLT
ncbi:MAG: amino acid dehydrogenase [Reichenbachiella sp.]